MGVRLVRPGVRLNPRVGFRVLPQTVARVGDVSARWTRAEGKSVDHPDAQRRLMLIGLRAVEACLACSASTPCPAHGMAAAFEAPSASSLAPTWTPAERSIAVSAYFEHFERVNSAKPVFGDREGKAINQLLEKVGAKRLIEEVLPNAFADPIWARKKGTTILKIAMDPSAYLGAPGTGSTFQQAPRSGRSWDRTQGVKIG